MEKPLLELVLFSDMHAHNFRFGAKRVMHEDGSMYNSRLIDCVTVLREIKAYCVKHNIEHVLFGGDLFHRRSILHTDVFNVIYEEIANMSNLKFVMIPGNHDYADRAGNVHSLVPFGRLPNVIVLEEYSLSTVGDKIAVAAVPFTDDPAEAKERLKVAGEMADRNKEVTGNPCILLAHLGMQGAKVGSDYVLVSDSDIGVDDVPYDKFTACFFGHYHQHQQLFPNGYYIGATHHHNWGDANTERGFIHLKVFQDAIEFERIETSVPRFLNVREDTIDSIHFRPSDFVRYHTTSDAGSLSAGELGQKFGVEQVELIEHRKDELEELRLPDDTLEPQKLVEVWTSSKVEEGSNRDELIELGKKLLAEAEEQIL